MAFVHGRTTKITVNAKDISPYTKTSSLEYAGDVHDTTGYGSTAHTKQGGLTDATFTCGGTYDNTASVGPRAALIGLLAQSTTIVRNPEGTGTGKPNESFTGILSKYTETNPVDDMVTWSATFEVSGAVTITTLP